MHQSKWAASSCITNTQRIASLRMFSRKMSIRIFWLDQTKRLLYLSMSHLDYYYLQNFFLISPHHWISEWSYIFMHRFDTVQNVRYKRDEYFGNSICARRINVS